MPPPPLGHHALRYSIRHLSGFGSQTSCSLSPTCLFFFGCISGAQRFVIIANDDIIETIIVEESAGELTVTEATVVLARL
jgi:hypothetical protein